ncbi:MAG: UvrD-helicase domain-containing protein, partial [Synergistaceae bacterium]|nr:UvrD-helicase domain-containing protein [Synergistaceae bacterium]
MINEIKNLLPIGTPDGQKQAVNLDADIITVTAGAGTGKTWVLSNRYARLLLSNNDILPKDILTLTYTDAAASEMKTRIEERVIKILNDDKNISAERKAAIIDGFGEAWISTIHAFARRIISESGLNVDIEPKADVISKPQEENFWNDIAQAVEFGNLR